VLGSLDDDDRAKVEKIAETAGPAAKAFLTDALEEVAIRKAGTFPPVEPEESSAIQLAALSEQLSLVAMAWRLRVSETLADALVQIMLAAQVALMQALHGRGDTEASEN